MFGPLKEGVVELPKGMMLPQQPPDIQPARQPPSLTEMNYAGMILEAIKGLPLQTKVEMDVKERAGLPPMVTVNIVILDKGGDSE